jgi:hypothetical protein
MDRYRCGCRQDGGKVSTSLVYDRLLLGVLFAIRFLLTDTRMIYSSITPYVHMLYTAEHESEHIQLDFTGSAQTGRSRGIRDYTDDHFGVSASSLELSS